MNIYVLSSIFAFLGSLAISLMVLVKGCPGPQKKAFISIALFAGTWCLFPAVAALNFSSEVTLNFVRVIYVFGLLTGPAFLNFGFKMSPLPFGKKEKFLISLSFLVAILLIPLVFHPDFIRGVSKHQPYFSLIVGSLFPIFILFFFLTCSLSFLRLFISFKISKGHKRNQLKYIFIAYFIAFISALIHFSAAYGFEEFIPHDFLVLVCMFVLAHAIAKYHLLDIKIVISRLTIFVCVYAMVLGVPLVLGYRYGLWMPATWTMLVLATAGPFLYLFLQRRAEEQFLRKDLKAQEFLVHAAQGMTTIHRASDLDVFVKDTLIRMLELDRAELYVLDPSGQRYDSLVPPQDPKGSRRFKTGEPVAVYLKTQTAPVMYEEIRIRAEAAGEDAGVSATARMMAEGGFQVVVPLHISDSLAGFICLGHRKTYEPYSRGLLNALLVLGSQTALAIENCRYVEAESRRVEEQGFQERVASLDMMASAFAHEIDNPMAVIGGQISFLETILEESKVALTLPSGIRGDMMKSFEYMREAADRVSGMIEAILEYSRMGTGELGPIRMGTAVESFLKIIAPQIKMSRVDFQTDIEADLPFILGDKVQIEEVLINFAVNAMHAVARNPEGDRRLRLKIFRRDAAMVRIAFQDNGYGIPEHLLKDIFLASVTTKGSSEGTGLGLYRVRKIADAHHGAVWAESEGEGRGAVFYFDIPVFTGDIQAVIRENSGRRREGPRRII